MKKKKILCVIGTRPEAIKMCPLIIEARKYSCFEVLLCVSGQHREMLDGVLRVFDITPEYDLSLMRDGQTLAELSSRMIFQIDKVLGEVSPDIVLVHGDTSTAFCASLAAFYRGIAVGHVEAGLRSGDLSEPFPEEFNRRAISLVSSYHFAPTAEAMGNLIGEGIDKGKISVTGNTVIDALKYTLKTNKCGILDGETRRIIVFTAHRRENLGEPMMNMLRALRRAVDAFDDTVAVCPMHKNPRVREMVISVLSGHERIILTEPLMTDVFHKLLSRSYIIMTDSGGIQEEASYLGKPTLVMRRVTERGEAERAGVIRLVGTDEDEIFLQASRLLSDEASYLKMAIPSLAFGDGRASERICRFLMGK